MKKENFDEKLKESLREYVKDTESEPTEKIKFSKRHERNMEEIFKSIENGTLGNFEVVENVIENVVENSDESNKSSVFYNKIMFNRLVRVAIFVLLALVVSLVVAPGIEAWKTDDLNLYEDERGEYAWVLPNDASEILEKKTVSGEEILEIFGWLPKGAEINVLKDTSGGTHILIFYDNKTLNFKIYDKNISIVSDIDAEDSGILINDKVVSYINTNENHCFVWNAGDRGYKMYGNIEYSEILKIIEELKY
jgi:hypothetical protein